jgi:hypothetical protein
MPALYHPVGLYFSKNSKRTNYVAYVWRNTRQANPSEFGPDGHGWKIRGDRLTMVWYESLRAPSSIIAQDSDYDGDTDEEDEGPGYSVSSDEDDNR